MDEDDAALLLTLATENTELRQQLAQAQEMLVETAIDAGHLHARIGALQAELAEVRANRDAWRAEAIRLKGGAPRTA
jgi:septal ring factor EnvC (AmiA/AmiB activator)